MNKISSNNQLYLLVFAATIFLFSGCSRSEKASPNPVTEYKPAKSLVRQLELVQLAVKGIPNSVNSIEGNFGDKSISMVAKDDTIVFMVPNITPGKHALSFKSGEKTIKAEYIVEETKVDNIEQEIGDFASKIEKRVVLLEQALKLTKLPPNGVLNTTEINILKNSADAFKINISKATAIEKEELAKFLVANPFMDESLGNLRINTTKEKFLALVKAILSEEGLKAFIFGAIGGLTIAAALGVAGALVGAALIIYAVILVKKAMFQIMELSQVPAVTDGGLEEIWWERIAAREIQSNKPYKLTYSIKYRTIGKKDAGNSELGELFVLNDKLVFYAQKLQEIKVLSWTIFDLRNQEYSSFNVAIEGKDIVTHITNNPKVQLVKKEASGDTLLLTFSTNSSSDEIFDLNISAKTEDGDFTKSETMLLKAAQQTELLVTPSYVDNYLFRGENSEKIQFKIQNNDQPVQWDISHGMWTGSIDSNGIFYIPSGAHQYIGDIKVRARQGVSQGFATIRITSGLLIVNVSATFGIRSLSAGLEQEAKIVSGKCIGKLLSAENDDKVTLKLIYEITPQLGENTIQLYNPYGTGTMDIRVQLTGPANLTKKGDLITAVRIGETKEVIVELKAEQ